MAPRRPGVVPGERPGAPVRAAVAARPSAAAARPRAAACPDLARPGARPGPAARAPRPGAPGGHQRVPLRPRGGQVALLDVAVAPDLLRNARDLERQADVGRPSGRASTSLDRSARYSPISARSVRRSSVRPKRSSGVPRRPLSLASTRNADQHPRAELLLLQLALVVALGDQRRRQVVVELVVALEHAPRSSPGSRCRCAGARPRTRPCRPSA